MPGNRERQQVYFSWSWVWASRSLTLGHGWCHGAHQKSPVAVLILFAHCRGGAAFCLLRRLFPNRKPAWDSAWKQHYKYGATVSSPWNQSHCLSHLPQHIPTPVTPSETFANNHSWKKSWRPLRIGFQVLITFLLCFGPLTPLLPIPSK